MPKRVLVIASGNTERLALPHLTVHLQSHGIAIDVRIPPNDRPVTANEVYRIIQSERYVPPTPDKYVVLSDTDGKPPEAVLQPIRSGLSQRLGEHFETEILYAYARWHLEAWYFADAQGLRDYFLGRALGSVDPSRPDDIENPKEHLKHLLAGRRYTAPVSEEIARVLDAPTIAQRSPSFAGFLAAVRNGGAGD